LEFDLSQLITALIDGIAEACAKSVGGEEDLERLAVFYDAIAEAARKKAQVVRLMAKPQAKAPSRKAKVG
jgi:hypothetical protein